MLNAESKIKLYYETIREKIEKLKTIHKDEEDNIDAYHVLVDELYACWQDFEKQIKDRVELEGVIQKASSSYSEETNSYDEELRQQAVDAINEEIDRLRKLINHLLQIHQQPL